MMTQALSPLEAIKGAINPYDGVEVFARLARGTVADITPEDDVVMRWHGLYRHRPLEDGVFMLRLKLPGGAIAPAPLLALADIADRFGGGELHLTTRQDIEMHRLTLAHLPAVFAELAAAGLTTVGACGDQVRNVVACPAAGLEPDELLDVTPTVQALTAAFLANPAFANLPRKCKIAVSACPHRCVPVEINDLSLVAARNAAGDVGYALFVGGGLSTSPRWAEPLHLWVAPEQAVALVGACVGIFRDHGNREQRGKARLKHLVAARGLAWFRAELEARLGYAPMSLETPPATSSRRDHLGAFWQRDGRVYLGVPILAGRLATTQARTLATAAGDGRLRVTGMQNLLLSDLPASRAHTVVAQLAAAGLPATENWCGRVVACTGKEFCAKSFAFSKTLGARLATVLDAHAGLPPAAVRISGCPNGCGQHAIADIGLQGAAARDDAGHLEERFDLWVGGGEAAEPAFARRLLARLRPDEVEGTVVSLLQRYRDEGEAGETFSDYARRALAE